MSEIIRSGFSITIMNRANGRIVFSACTGEITSEAFYEMWHAVGGNIWQSLQKTKSGFGEYAINIVPLGETL